MKKVCMLKMYEVKKCGTSGVVTRSMTPDFVMRDRISTVLANSLAEKGALGGSQMELVNLLREEWQKKTSYSVIAAYKMWSKNFVLSTLLRCVILYNM